VPAPRTDDSLKPWYEIFHGKNFIFLSVEYGRPTFEFDPTTGKFKSNSKSDDYYTGRNAVYALDLLARQTKIDKSNAVLVNASTGDYDHQKLGNPAFALYVPIGHLSWNDSEYMRKPVRRPVLWINPASGGVSVSALDYLRKNRWDVTTITSDDDFTKTPTSEVARAQIREWFYQRLPLFAEPYQLHQRIQTTPNAAGKLKLQTKLGKSWLDLPWIEEARKAVAEPTK